MKKTMMLIVLSIAFYGNIEAKKKFIPAIFFLHDGTQIECFSREIWSLKANEIPYKESKKSNVKIMKSVDIKTILYMYNDGKVSEWDYCSVISIHSLSRGIEKIEPLWLNVKTRGIVTLYENTSFVKERYGRDSYIVKKVYSYYCIREDEIAASNILAYQSDHIFPKLASDYFSDSPEISKNILQKVKGYEAKDIVEIVFEYNSEKLAKINSK